APHRGFALRPDPGGALVALPGRAALQPGHDGARTAAAAPAPRRPAGVGGKDAAALPGGRWTAAGRADAGSMGTGTGLPLAGQPPGVLPGVERGPPARRRSPYRGHRPAGVRAARRPPRPDARGHRGTLLAPQAAPRGGRAAANPA